MAGLTFQFPSLQGWKKELQNYSLHLGFTQLKVNTHYISISTIRGLKEGINRKKNKEYKLFWLWLDQEEINVKKSETKRPFIML